MNNTRVVAVSKRLSLRLRHSPDSLGIRLGAGGWVPIDVLLAALARHGLTLTRTELEDVVARNDKKRFAIDETGTLIRAGQGHSVPVDLGLTPTRSPRLLYHAPSPGSCPRSAERASSR